MKRSVIFVETTVFTLDTEAPFVIILTSFTIIILFGNRTGIY